MTIHPKGTRARVLFSSVFGPYAQDDEFGSRAINPMELYHNQVTREQGAFSLRMFHRSWGIMMIQENISAPCTVLDFPTREAFARGTDAPTTTTSSASPRSSSTSARCARCAAWCASSRRSRRSSSAGTSPPFPGIEHMIDADHIVNGDGIAWMRRYLGEDANAPIRHPADRLRLRHRASWASRCRTPKGTTAATIIPSVGCPMGCNFCTTSAFFGGKGKFLNFYETGEELFDVMCEMEATLNVQLVLHDGRELPAAQRTRAMELLELHEGSGTRAWALYVFSSANAIRKYTMRGTGGTGRLLDLDGPGIAALRLRQAEGRRHARRSPRELREHGIKLLGSTIVGLEHHTPENIDDEIEHAIAHETDFHQFMLYTPVPGTPLYREMEEQGRMLLDVDLADIHGQYKFNFEHAAISRERLQAVPGLGLPARLRAQRPEPLPHLPHHAGGLAALQERPRPARPRALRARGARVEQRLRRRALGDGAPPAPHQSPRSRSRSAPLRQEIGREFGLRQPRDRRACSVPYLLWTARREERRLAAGRDLRAADHHRAPQLDAAGSLGLRRARRSLNWSLRAISAGPSLLAGLANMT